MNTYTIHQITGFSVLGMGYVTKIIKTVTIDTKCVTKTELEELGKSYGGDFASEVVVSNSQAKAVIPHVCV